MATENFGPEYGDEDQSTLSTRESDIIDRRDKKNFNKKMSSTQRPASCGKLRMQSLLKKICSYPHFVLILSTAMITNEAFFQIRRPESWDVSSWPREQINKVLCIYFAILNLLIIKKKKIISFQEQTFPMTTFGGAKRKHTYRTQIEENI